MVKEGFWANLNILEERRSIPKVKILIFLLSNSSKKKKKKRTPEIRKKTKNKPQTDI